MLPEPAVVFGKLCHNRLHLKAHVGALVWAACVVDREVKALCHKLQLGFVHHAHGADQGKLAAEELLHRHHGGEVPTVAQVDERGGDDVVHVMAGCYFLIAQFCSLVKKHALPVPGAQVAVEVAPERGREHISLHHLVGNLQLVEELLHLLGIGFGHRVLVPVYPHGVEVIMDRKPTSPHRQCEGQGQRVLAPGDSQEHLVPVLYHLEAVYPPASLLDYAHKPGLHILYVF